jgi:zinc protease
VSKVADVEGIHEYRLSNGLKVLLLPDTTKPTVTVNVTYLVGSRHENYGETGMAHLLEHLLFKGSKKYLKIDQEFNRRGMNPNATTALDRTHYFESFQASNDNLKWAINMEADRMVNAFIAQKDLDSEMTVVRNEFENGENSPFNVLWKRMQSVTFDWHNYGNSTIGNRSDIENVKIENLQAFYRLYYQPDNAALVIAGQFDEVTTLAWIAQSFGKIAKPTRKLPQLWTVEPTQDGERSVMVRRKGDVQLVFVAYRIPASLHADSDALSLASNILTDTPNGRLHKLLVETGKVTSVFGMSETGFAPGMLLIGVEIKKGEPIEPVRDVLIAAIEDFSKTPPTTEEMAREYRNYANYFEKMMNNPQRVSAALTDSLVLGDWRLLLNSRDVVAGMQPAQVAAAAGRYFKRDNRTVGVFMPEDQPQRAQIPVAPSAAEALKTFKPHTIVAAGEAFDPSQANIDARTQHQTIGGVKVAMLPKKNRGETVNVAFQLHWGDEKSLFAQSTAAGFAGGMLARGTSKFTRQQLADEFDRLKISGGVYGFETTRDHLVEALKLMAHVLKEPTFPESEFEQMRKQALTDIESGRNDPSTLASEAMETHFNRYPKGDWRAAKTTDVQLAETKAITLNEVKAFYQKFYGASSGEMAIVGDFDPAEISKVVNELYGNWRSPVPYTRVSSVNFDVPVLHKTIDTPDKENGNYVAQLNLDRRDDDRDYPALLVANYLFGGGAGLDSRLMQRVRQKEGLSYNIGSFLSIGSLDRDASFGIYAIAAPQNMAKVEITVKDELERVLKTGFSEAEVARAKSGILQQRLQARTRDGTIANSWSNYLFLGRMYAWSRQLEEKINALTAEQVNAAFRQAIDPNKLSVVMAFDQAKAKK